MNATPWHIMPWRSSVGWRFSSTGSWSRSRRRIANPIWGVGSCAAPSHRIHTLATLISTSSGERSLAAAWRTKHCTPASTVEAPFSAWPHTVTGNASSRVHRATQKRSPSWQRDIPAA